ncbi:hypothetical protein WMF38_20770 [Sorangium sp. So ce118]
MLETMLERLDSFQHWLPQVSTELLVVAAVRDDEALIARWLVEALAEVGRVRSAVVVNRTLPETLAGELEGAVTPEEAAAVVRCAAATGIGS